METTREQINEATKLLRTEIDSIHDKLFDETGSMAVANIQTKDLYDAVTLLHEQAMEHLDCDDGKVRPGFRHYMS